MQIKLLIRRLGRIVGANTILGDPTSSSLLRKDTALTGHAQFPAVKASLQQEREKITCENKQRLSLSSAKTVVPTAESGGGNGYFRRPEMRVPGGHLKF